MSPPPGSILVGTVALEPNRWGTVDPSGVPTMAASRWAADIDRAGFDGMELWEGHLVGVAEAEVAHLVAGPVPITILNTYTSLDVADPTGRREVAEWAGRVGCLGVKYNVGNDPAMVGAYAERVASWSAMMPPQIALLCECHAGLSIAEDPTVAAAIFDAAGPADRVQAIVHTHEAPDHLRARFDAYGDRISHVHVNYLDPVALTAPTLADVRDDLEAKASLLDGLGFRGSWTVEFVHGVLTDHDEPGFLMGQAVRDHDVLRGVLAAVSP